ncbi:MAG: hypothetical protein F6K22_14930 [Okeania sp. SIO2F4]|uniref:hypothetical protein n=1 Tax=Okeania sp. SIO2F4 TaxID=2607790 RepID=UPI0014296D92|nr:hypothetical protein [Okeania sp. SIO2F4]NES04016.1 hypothetical protein [Okeania sp. SIO2F4]
MNSLITNFFSNVWHKFPHQISKLVGTLVITFFLLLIGTIFIPVPFAHAAMVLYCDGLDAGGNPYTATYVDGLFTEVRFDRSPDLPPVVSELTYDTVNEQGQPIYRGGYLGAADVVLIDLSGGNVKPGSEVSVSVDNGWNLERGICGV